MYVEMLARMTAAERVQFVEMLCEKWPHLATEISNSIDRLLKNQNLRNSLIKKGFDNIKGYKKEVILKKHLKVYNKVINDL